MTPESLAASISMASQRSSARERVSDAIGVAGSCLLGHLCFLNFHFLGNPALGQFRPSGGSHRVRRVQIDRKASELDFFDPESRLSHIYIYIYIYVYIYIYISVAILAQAILRR